VSPAQPERNIFQNLDQHAAEAKATAADDPSVTAPTMTSWPPSSIC